MKKGGDEMTPSAPIQASANPWSDGGNVGWIGVCAGVGWLFFQRLEVEPDGLELGVGVSIEEVGEGRFAGVIGEARHFGIGIDATGEEEPAIEVSAANALVGEGEVGAWSFKDCGGGAIA